MILQVNSKYREKVIKNNFRKYSVECYFFVDLNTICVILTGLCVFLKNICMCQHLINKCKTLKKFIENVGSLHFLFIYAI